MNATKIALGLAGAAIVAGSTFGLATTSFAADPQPAPGRMGGMATAGTMRGAGYGATSMTSYLAEKLGVAEADLQKALDAYRAEHTQTVRGRDRDAATLTTDHDALASYLAEQLKLDKATVLDALNGMQSDRQADRTAQIKTQLETAVKDGRLTQAQADAILAAHDSGAMRGGFGRR